MDDSGHFWKFTGCGRWMVNFDGYICGRYQMRERTSVLRLRLVHQSKQDYFRQRMESKN